MVLKHRETSQIFTCWLINNYNFTYYGTKFWEDRETAEEQAEAFLRSAGSEDPAQWELLEVAENKLKIFNVKLKNNAGLRLYLDDGGFPVVRQAELE